MKTVTTKAIAKVAAVATGLAMATSMLSLAPIAHAAALTSSQVQSILSLLSSFGADSTTIANVQASLTGSTPVTTGTGSTSSATFTRDLTVGSTGTDVTALQNALKAGGYMTANATGYFGALTKAGVIAWQTAKGVSPAAGYFGPKSRAVFGGTTTTDTTGGTVNAGTGTGLKVSLASDSPNGVALVQGQAAAELAKFTFANPTATAIKVTNLAFNRIGVSNDSTMTNVYLYTGAVRLTDSAGVSSGAYSFQNSEGVFTVPAGGVYTVSVRSDIAGSTSGQQIGAKLVSVASNGTLDGSVSFPISGGLQSVSAATLANVDLGTATSPTSNTVDPQADYTVWQNTVTVGTRAVLMKSLALRNIGSVQSGDVTNYRLYVDGVRAGDAVAKFDTNNMVTFDLSASPVRLETGGRVIKVVADIVGGASRTFQLSLRYAADAIFYDTDLNQPILVRGDASAITNSFAAHSATSATINSVSTSAPSITRSTDSPTAAVANGQSNVKWATFKIIANGEDIKVDNLNVSADTSSSGVGLDNGKVFLNGIQVGSTKDVAEFGGATTNYTFGSSFIVKVGTTAVVDVYADAKTSASANLTANETVRIYLGVGSSNAQGQVSLSSINVPASEVTGNAITVSASSLSANKASYYGNQTVIAGAQNVKVGAFTLSTGATEGASVNTIEIGFASAVLSTLSDLVIKDHDSGVAFGTSKATVGTANSFSGSVSIAASGTKTFDIYANVKSGANAGAIPVTTVTTNTTGTGAITGSTVSVASAPTLQTITVGPANLIVALNAGSTPDKTNIIAGSAMVKVGSFRFTTQYSPYTVDQIKVKVLAEASTAVSSVVLQYKDAAGATQTATQSLALSSGAQTHSTATFTGLTFFVPADSNRDLDVYVNTPTVASAPSASGKAISVILDYNEGFNATDSSGTADILLTASADIASTDATGKGAMVVRKSIATIAAGTAPSTTLNTGADQVLGTFNVTADAAGDIDWGQTVFTVSKTAALTIGATTTLAVWDVTSGSTRVTGSFATTTGNLLGGLDALAGNTSGLLHFRPDTVQTVAAGATRKYELRGTVGGTAAGANNISVSIANPSSTTVTTAAFLTVAGATLASATTNPSFVWSDWSDATNHATTATTATDWTSDYLVKTLPLTIGNRSLNF
ncbi:MAG: peptidoglycan-binding domain-containing protein [Candidatus Pacebacteria bacterium]|nr:peptidoglycan-binding domain-containing protein [Candidatus Paceibacterota bacterium]